jgi:hypothetical protein
MKHPDDETQWYDWAQLPMPAGTGASHVAAVSLSNGTLQLFATGTNGNLYSRWMEGTQTGAPWSDWSTFANVSGDKIVQLAGAPLSDDRPIVFAITASGSIYSCWKESVQPDAHWTAWAQFKGKPPAKLVGLALVPLPDKRLQLFASSSAGGNLYNLWTSWKVTTDPMSPWTPWSQVPLPAGAPGVSAELERGVEALDDRGVPHPTTP